MINPFDIILVLIYSLISWLIIAGVILFILYKERAWIYTQVKNFFVNEGEELVTDIEDLGKDAVNWVIGEVKSIF